MEIIAKIHTDLPEKFGIPRQSGLVPELKGTIVFEPQYRDENAVRGIEEFSHLWIIWKFSKNPEGKWSPTVRPPRLGGNERKGVFATRSPFRPNPIGLSCVRLDSVVIGEQGPVLKVSGIDMADGTPVLDIKPYIPYADSHPDASGGFADEFIKYSIEVKSDDALLSVFSEEQKREVIGMIQKDPRPSYQHNDERIYGISFAGYNIRFVVRDHTAYLLDCQPNI